MKKTAFLKWLSLGLLLGFSVACHDDDEEEPSNNNGSQQEQQSEPVKPTVDQKGQLPKLVEEQSLRFNLWAENNVSWVGAFDANSLPITQYIDYVKVSSYNESTKSFEEIWTDDFDSFDATRWGKGNWRMGLVTENVNNVVVEDGVLKMRMTQNGENYYGAEIFTKETFKYGRFEAKMKMACASGCISSMFLYYNNSDKGGTYQWNELDIEILGKNPKAFQSNIITGSKSKQVTSEQIHSLPYATNGDYHVYVMEWTPEYVLWTVDGVEMRRTVAQ